MRSVFEDAFNYMKSGQLLRQIINKLNAISFHRQADRHQFNDLYEKILRDLQAASNAGEFSPARRHPVHGRHRQPATGETVLDPACGTGGFLVCALEHLRQQVKNEAGSSHAANQRARRSRKSSSRTCSASPTSCTA